MSWAAGEGGGLSVLIPGIANWLSGRGTLLHWWGKSPSLCELEQYQLDIVWHSLVTGGKFLTDICIYTPNSSSDYLAFLESLGGVLKGVPPGDFIAFLWDFNAHVGNDGVIRRGGTGRNGLPDLNLSSELLLDFCVSH